MLRGPEAYLEMWEGAIGVPNRGCQAGFTASQRAALAPIRLGMTPRKLLMHAGQPLHRSRAWTDCVNGKRNRHASASAVLTPGGRVALVATNVPGQRALSIGPGASAGAVRRVAEPVGGGLWRAKLGASTAVFVVRGGRVRTVGLAGAGSSSRTGS